MAGTEPAGWGIPAVMGKCRRRHRGALRSSPGPEPSAGISPKDGTEHGSSIPVTRPEKNSKGFMYETRDAVTCGIISQRSRSCPAPAVPVGRLRCGRRAVPAGMQQVMALRRQASALQGTGEPRCQDLKFPNLIHSTVTPTAALPTAPRALD